MAHERLSVWSAFAAFCGYRESMGQVWHHALAKGA